PQPQQHEVIGFPGGESGRAEGERVRSSPLVRRIARENNVDLSRVPGTGLGGRISKQDIQSFIEQYGAGRAAQAAPQQPTRTGQMPQPQAAAQPASVPTPRPPAAPAVQVLPGELVPMTPMRKKIAERMVESKHTSAHVHSIFKVDMTRIAKFREKNRKAW